VGVVIEVLTGGWRNNFRRKRPESGNQRHEYAEQSYQRQFHDLLR
jgi:hypothetical protein